MGRHQKSFQPVMPSTRGRSSEAIPNSCGTISSARNAPIGPMKLRASPLTPDLKKGAGSDGLYVARLMRSIRARAKATSPMNSASRVDCVLPLGMTSDLHQYGDDQGPSLRPLPEDAPQILAETLARDVRVVALLRGP